MLRETILEFGKLKNDLQVLLPIHDSILFLAPEKDKAEYLELTREIMERAFPQLEGLRCMTEASIGCRWSEMEEV
jgi:DNA polymerase I-like protein with 3'-5' exonuclease and polymerase domains